MTNTTPPIKYVTRPRPEGRRYGCPQCATTIVLYVKPTEVLHQCKRTRRWSELKPQ